MNQEGFLEAVVHRDEDAAILRDQNGNLYIQTNQIPPDDEEEEITCLNGDLLYNAAIQRPALNANVRPLSALFLIELIVTLQMILFALPLYYWPLSRTAHIITLVLGCNGCAGFYAAMIALRKHDLLYLCATLELFFLSLTAVVGSVAGLTQSTIPFILFGLLWIQYLVVFIYIQLSGGSISYIYALILMAAATLCAWSINIVTYGSAHEWIGGIVCLTMAMLMVIYNSWQIKRGDKRYNNGIGDTVQSIVNYYCDVIIINVFKT